LLITSCIAPTVDKLHAVYYTQLEFPIQCSGSSTEIIIFPSKETQGAVGDLWNEVTGLATRRKHVKQIHGRSERSIGQAYSGMILKGWILFTN